MIELTLITPVVVLVMLFIVGCGRSVEAGLRVEDAAHQAARAASLARDPITAEQDAETVAAQALPASGASCPRSHIGVDTSDFRPGGEVTVTVSCHVSLSDLSGIPLPISAGTRTASFTSPIDTFRATTSTP